MTHTAESKSELEQMSDLFDSLTEDQMQIINDMVKHYADVFNSAGHPFRGLKILYAVTDEENKSTQAKSTCTKGCCHCCHIRVASLQVEADMIVQHCKQNNISIDTDKLEKLQDLDEVSYMFSPHKRCTFLDTDGTCKIYDVRPFSCRNYYVSSSPQDCDTNTNPHGRTAVIMNLPANLPAVAVMQTYRPGNFAKQLLQAINNKQP